MYQQDPDPLGGNLALSALLAAIPLLVLFLMLGVFRVRAWLASLTGLVLSLGIASFVYGMPLGLALNSAAEGAAFGLFPAMWIVVNAIWIYRLTVASGHFDVLRRAFAGISDDRRIQGIIIAFSFGALLEALAGFGAPVAICAVMLVAIGLQPLKAATVALIANTAPVAYGAVALPIITLAQVTGLPQDELSAMTGRQVPLLALLVPFVLVVVLDGRRGLREVWPAALVCGSTFAFVQFLMANFGAVELTDIAASLASALALLVLLRAWQPRKRDEDMRDSSAPLDAERPGSGAGTAVLTRKTDSRPEVVRALAPYAVIIGLFSVSAVPQISSLLEQTTRKFPWPGLDIRSVEGEPLALTSFKFDWLASGGTVLLIAGLISVLVLGLSGRQAMGAYGETLRQLRTAVLTVTAVLAIAYVMNLSGQTATMGLFLAGAGGLFSALSPLLGWFGTAVTGSDTSSNSLFGALQVRAAEGAGLHPVLTAGSNTTGGVLGKMISPQNLAVGAGAVGLAGREGELFRRVLAVTVIFLPLTCLLTYLQSTAVLSWMVP